MIPEEIFNQIVADAKEEYPNDRQMQKYQILEQKEGYAKIQALDFMQFEHLKTELIACAQKNSTCWHDIYGIVREELESFIDIQNFTVDGIEPKIIEDWKEQAVQEDSYSYANQLNILRYLEQKHSSIAHTRKTIDPIKRLLIELENIVGNECYNENIQNYHSWGELESEGREFRYPVTFKNQNSEKYKRKNVLSSIPSEDLITGYYAFGANQLHIYRALYKIISHLRKNYNLQI